MLKSLELNTENLTAIVELLAEHQMIVYRRRMKDAWPVWERLELGRWGEIVKRTVPEAKYAGQTGLEEMAILPLDGQKEKA